MLLDTFFTAFNEEVHVTVNTKDLDRNYDDEEYAYWIVERNGHYYEVNIWKDEDGNFTNNGKVYAFADYGKFEDAGEPDEECDITFIQLTNTEYENLYDQIQDITNNVMLFVGKLEMTDALNERTKTLLASLKDAASKFSDIAHEVEEHFAWD